MQYLRGWRAMRQDPEWLGKMGIGVLLMFVPVVGPIVLYGWQTLMLRRAVSGQESPLPRLELNMDYLMKLLMIGFKAYIARLLWTLPAMAAGGIMGCCMYMGIIGSAMVGSNGNDELGVVGIIVTMVAFFVLYPLLMIAASMPMQVAVTRAEITDDLNSAMRFGEVMAMTKLIAKELFVGNLVMMGISMVAVLFGLVTCYLGLFPAMFVLPILYTYWQAGLYNAYIEKGGQPLAVGPLDVEPPPQNHAPAQPPTF